MFASLAGPSSRERQNLRTKVFNEIFNSISIAHSSQSREDITSLRHALTLGDIVAPGGKSSGTEHDNVPLPGGLTELDLRRFASLSEPKIDIPIEDLISDHLESTIVSISDFYNGSKSGSSTRDLGHEIEQRLGEITASAAEEHHLHDRIQRLIQEINETHPRLHQRLAYALEKLPPDIASRHSAQSDLLAMTIEASLVKVSLIRAKALQTVYNYQSPKNPELHMRGALSAACAKLKEEEGEMEEEERKLDRELAEYQTLLDMVDGGGSGGFRQVVADCARVKKETEECKRDLRRLGWTGEN
ncbi:hypothetical protein B0H11DRAFT_1852870 [Mycena galericulata]|nr:hypothetical protein B0H11DRAFT_1852870 [Mycena galericulata]